MVKPPSKYKQLLSQNKKTIEQHRTVQNGAISYFTALY